MYWQSLLASFAYVYLVQVLNWICSVVQVVSRVPSLMKYDQSHIGKILHTSFMDGPQANLLQYYDLTSKVLVFELSLHFCNIELFWKQGHCSLFRLYFILYQVCTTIILYYYTGPPGALSAKGAHRSFIVWPLDWGQ